MWPMTSGDRITSRMASAAFGRCVGLLPKFSMLKPPTVNSSAAGGGTGMALMLAMSGGAFPATPCSRRR